MHFVTELIGILNRCVTSAGSHADSLEERGTNMDAVCCGALHEDFQGCLKERRLCWVLTHRGHSSKCQAACYYHKK